MQYPHPLDIHRCRKFCLMDACWGYDFVSPQIVSTENKYCLALQRHVYQPHKSPLSVSLSAARSGSRRYGGENPCQSLFYCRKFPDKRIAVCRMLHWAKLHQSRQVRMVGGMQILTVRGSVNHFPVFYSIIRFKQNCFSSLICHQQIDVICNRHIQCCFLYVHRFPQATGQADMPACTFDGCQTVYCNVSDCQTGLWSVILIRHIPSPIFMLFNNSTSASQANAFSKRTLL